MSQGNRADSLPDRERTVRLLAGSAQLRHKAARRAFTLFELLVMVGIITILVGIALPVMTMVRAQALSVSCQSSQRQIGLGVLNFTIQNRGRMPDVCQCWPDATKPRGYATGTIWTQDLAPDLDASEHEAANEVTDLRARSVVAGCPYYNYGGSRSATPWNTGFGMNPYLRDPQRDPVSGFRYVNAHPENVSPVGVIYQHVFLAQVSEMSQRLLVADTGPTFGGEASYVGTPENLKARHRNRLNALFCDGHLASITAEQASSAITNPATCGF